MSFDYDLAKQKYDMKIHSVNRRDGIELKLSFNEYCQLMVDSNITPDMISKHSGGYCLARIDDVTGVIDSGDYVVGNCRFILSSENVAMANSARSISEETRAKLSVSSSGNNNPMYGKQSAMKGRHHTEESKDKMSKNRKGKCSGAEHPCFGKPRSDETKKKIGNSQRGEKHHSFGKKQPQLTCPHCGLTGGVAPLKGYHFDKCKQYKGNK